MPKSVRSLICNIFHTVYQLQEQQLLIDQLLQ